MMQAADVVEIILRPMELKDVEQVYAIDVLSFALPWSERAYRYELNENRLARLWVAEAINARSERRVAGMIVLWLILDEAHIATIAIHPDFRRMGIARRLLRQALDDAAEKGTRCAFLEVRRSNLAAQALYNEFGFEVTGVRPKYYVDTQEDALLMTLEPIKIGGIA